MGILTKNMLKKIVGNIREVRLEKRDKDREKRQKEKDKDENVKGINLGLNKLAKLSASDILKLIYSLKEQKVKFTLT